MTFQCPGCGAQVEHPGHQCHPAPKPEDCPFCGKKPSLSSHMCPEKIRKMEFVCLNCGRLAVASGEKGLCRPLKLFL
ncbi:MAG: hypothetical protein M0Z59_09545 [Nitrospiraceae bacterium]|nr:hypothetical protein [Nitrospiraceae bacterium]